MNRINNPWLALGLSLLLFACNDMLDETPRSVLTPGFFSSPQGLEAGLNAAYAGLRSHFYGGGITGTDEFTLTDAVNATEACTNTYDNLLNSVNGAGGTWQAFIYINTCNGILEKGMEIDNMDESRRRTLFAETRFLRALYYLQLVQTYGPVPLDLGTGKLAFNSTATTLSVRNSVAEAFRYANQLIENRAATDANSSPTTPSSIWRGTKTRRRPSSTYRRMYTPTPWLIFDAFDDKANDSRWDGSFRMMWRCRASAENGSSAANIEKLAAYGMQYGDTAILLLLTDEIPPQHQNRKYVIYTPQQFYMNSAAQYMYPNLTKYDDTRRFALNDVSMRPVFIARLAETYLMAAEALVMQGRKQEALLYVNAVRRRAAHREGMTGQQLADAEQAMTLTDPGALDIDFILDERTREMCGEGWRWFDLTRTGKLVERVRLHNEKAAPNIRDFHVLRPIPQTQLDLMSDEAQRASYQNEGYD
jgi:hypothetical protein